MTTYNGHCLCGQTEWTANLEKDQTEHILCHCDTCKYLSGGTYTMNQIIPSSALKLGKGGDALKAYTYYGESGKPVHCYYCPNCTCHVYHHQTVLGDKYILRTALLPDLRKSNVAAEIFGKAKLHWEPEIAKTFETLPPEE